MTTQQADFDVTTLLEVAPRSDMHAINLYTASLGEMIWPAEKRIIYCNVSGRPWGYVSEDYVRDTVVTFGDRNQKELINIVNRITLFNGASPLWQSKTPDMLQQNKMIDPAGFLVYMLNQMMRQVRAEEAKGNLDYEIAWHKQMTINYRAYTKMDNKFLDRVNEIMLMVSGVDCFPATHLLKGTTLADYITRDQLEHLVGLCGKNYKRRKSEKRYYAHQAHGHRIHAATAERMNGIVQFDDKTKTKVYEMLMVELFKEIDVKFLPEQRKRAATLNNYGSATLLEIEKTIAVAAKPAVVRGGFKLKVEGNKVIKPGQKVVLNFGPKKEA